MKSSGYVILLCTLVSGCTRYYPAKTDYIRKLPDHDWTFTVGDLKYGLVGIDSQTGIYCGPLIYGIAIPFPAFLTLLGVFVAAAVFFLALWRRRHRDNSA